MTKTVRIIGALLAVGLLASACGGGEKSVDLAGTVVDPPFTVATDALKTDEGAPFTLATDTTKPLTLVFFGYTNCPDTCPAVLSSIASGLAKLSQDQQDDVQVLFITSDPDRDTATVLRDYLDRFDPDFVGLTGGLPAIAKISRSIGVFVDDGAQLASGGYDPNSHTSYVIGIDDTHTAPIFWRSETAPSEYARDIAFLLAERPEKLKPGNLDPGTG